MRHSGGEVPRHMSPPEFSNESRRVESRTLWLVLAVAAFGFAFFKLGSEMLEGETQALDQQVLRALRRADDPAHLVGPAWFEHAVLDLTALGGPTVICLGVLLTLCYLLFARRRIAAKTIFVSTAGAFALTASLKWFFDRARPTVVPPLSTVSSGSFPSGHAALSAAVYLTMAALLAREAPNPGARRFVLAAGVLLTFLVGATRVLMGVHYPSDVLAGWILGSAWALLCSGAARRWRRARAASLGGASEETATRGG